MINSQKPLIQRQVFNESHDYSISSINPGFIISKIRALLISDLRCFAANLGCSSIAKRLIVVLPGGFSALGCNISCSAKPRIIQKSIRKGEINFEVLLSRKYC